MISVNRFIFNFRLELAKIEEPNNKQVEEEMLSAGFVEKSIVQAREALRENKGRLAMEYAAKGLERAPYCPTLRLIQAEGV
jgi:hypothetical protein